MPNIASALKSEIARIARRELRAEADGLKKSSARYRSEIASLKKKVTDLERLVSKLGKKGDAGADAIANPELQSTGDGLRFRAAGLASHRERLGLSAREAAQILGVSALTVYKWESGKTQPRRSQMPAIAAFRKLGKREAQASLKG